MKKTIALLLILVVLGLSGCAQKTAQKVTEATGTTAPAVTPASDTAEISNDVDSISKEIAGINASDTGDAITPISAADLTD